MVSIVRKAFLNKKNNQFSVAIPRKEIKKVNPTIKYDEDLMVSIKILRRKKNGVYL